MENLFIGFIKKADGTNKTFYGQTIEYTINFLNSMDKSETLTKLFKVDNNGNVQHYKIISSYGKPILVEVDKMEYILDEENYTGAIPELSQYESNLVNKWVKKVEYAKMGNKTAVCLITLKNGFEILGTSAPIKAENYVQKLGNIYALKRALDKLSQIDGFSHHGEEV